MIDLNDYLLFAEVVKHGGFAAAGRALRLPKSKLSRRIAALEARLGIRLIERSSRRFRKNSTTPRQPSWLVNSTWSRRIPAVCKRANMDVKS